MMANFFEQFDPATPTASGGAAPAAQPVEAPTNFFAQFDQPPAAPVTPQPDNVPIPPERPAELGASLRNVPDVGGAPLDQPTPSDSVVPQNPASAEAVQLVPDDPNAPPKPSVIDALTRGLIEGGKEVGDTAQAIGNGGFDQTIQKQVEDKTPLGQQLAKPLAEGWRDPNWWAVQLAYGTAKSAPTLAAATAGTAIGTAIEPGAGTLIGGAGGMALGSAMQTLAPAYQKARQEGLSHDEAVDRALKETGIATAFGAAMGAAPGVSIFGKDAMGALKRPISEALAQVFGVQPGLMAGQKATTQAAEGKPQDDLATQAQDYLMNVVTGGVLVGGHKAVTAPFERPHVMPPQAGDGSAAVDDFLGRAAGMKTKQEIDEFLRQKQAAETAAAPRLPPPGKAATDFTPPETPPAAAQPEAPTPAPSGGPSNAEPPAVPNAPADTAGAAGSVPDRASGAVAPAAVNPPAAAAPGVAPAPIPDDDVKILLGAGHDPSEIATMNPAERADAVAEATDAGVKPAAEITPEQRAELKPIEEPTPGTREAPVKAQTPADVEQAAAQVDQSATPAQLDAGNAKLGHVVVQGIPISIETPAGGTRTSTTLDENGNPTWSVPNFPAAYGRIKGTVGADGEHVDAYIGENPQSQRVFVIDQFDPKTGKFDEHKSFVAFDSADQAAAVYDRAFPDGSAFMRHGGVHEMNVDQFKAWLARPGARRTPVSEAGKARHNGKTPGIQPLAEDAGTVSAPGEPGLSAVRGQGNNDRPEVGQLPGVPGRHGAQAGPAVLSGSDSGSGGVRPDELPVGNAGAAGAEQAGVRPQGGVSGENSDRGGVGAGSGLAGNNSVLPDRSSAVAGGKSSDATAEGNRQVNLAGGFQGYLRAGNGFQTIIQARKFANEHYGVTDPKRIEEDLEYAVVREARRIVYAGGKPAEVFEKLVDLYGRQPKLGTRTSTSIANQAYSTPVPLAYVADKLAGMNLNTTVYEPTAGNGALLLLATPGHVTANELNTDRAASLKAQGFKTTTNDASDPTQSRVLKNAGGVDVVIANPPFGAVKGADGETIRHDLTDIAPKYHTNEVDHAIALRALEAMKDDGRAVLILGAPNKLANQSDAYNGLSKRAFYKTLFDRYNVVDHLIVNGDLYARQGAAWPVDVIVIHGRGKSELALPAASPPRILNTWSEVGALLNGSDAGVVRGENAGRLPGAAPAVRGEPAPGDRGHSGAEPVAGGEDGSQKQPVGVAEPNRGSEPVARPAAAAPAGGKGGRGAQPRAAGAAAPAGPDGLSDTAREILAAIDALPDDPVAPAPPEEKASGATPRAPAGPRTSAEVAKSAVVNAGDTMAEVAKGLADLFGPSPGGPRFGSGPSFDEETYAKAKPHFIKAARHFWDSMKDVGELVGRLVQTLRDQFAFTKDMLRQMLPYLTRFVDEVRGGKIKITPERTESAKEADAARAAKPVVIEKENAKQVTYDPASAMAPMGTLSPVNLKASVRHALDELAAKHGSIDAYVSESIGYEPGEIAANGYFGAEQMDALALAISNIEAGKGFIIGDQTGIGKGRVNAGMIAYAINKGLTPVFMTEATNLYGDMIRDLNDIGRPIDPAQILMTNSSGDHIPLDADALDWAAERDAAVENDTPIPPRRGRFLSMSANTRKHEAKLAEMGQKGDIGNHKVVFTTYDQMNTVAGKLPDRAKFIKAIAPGAMLMADEAHNAGGSGPQSRAKKGAPPPRSVTVREIVMAAKGVFYSSATFAKRPNVMDLYVRTDLGLAVSDPADLADVIAKGGVPMQQVVSAMLAKSGQYVRRERSFEGIRYDTPSVSVDEETYDRFSRALRHVLDFSLSLRPIVGDISAKLKAAAKAVREDGATGGAGANATNFASVMHNLIGQFLLALKADAAAERAIQALKAGEKPVLTVANTNESFLQQFADMNGLKAGDTLELDFRSMLQRYLDRSRRITLKDHTGEKSYYHLTDEDLGGRALALYNEAKAFIAALELEHIPVSPVDWMKFRLKSAGFNVGEITGRTMTLDYSAGEEGAHSGRLIIRPQAERSASGKTLTISKFNNQQGADGLHAVILNQAGSTGLSLHASSRFVNQQPRLMLLAQAEADINTHMQMLGRVNRTGQTALPRYEQLVASVPAELRPASVLAKKMASLSASTTANRKGSLTSEDVPDVMNVYGDQAVAAWAADNMQTMAVLDLAGLDLNAPDIIQKITGRLAVLPIEEQRDAWDDIIGRFKDLLEQAEAEGTNALEAKTLDLDAKETQRVELAPKDGPSPFQDSVVLHEMDVKRLGKPFSGDDVVKALTDRYGVPENAGQLQPHQLMAEVQRRAQPAHTQLTNDAVREAVDFSLQAVARDAADPERAAKTDQELAAQREQFSDMMRVFEPGAVVRLIGDEQKTAIVIGVDRMKNAKSPNPLAGGNWRVKLAGDFGANPTFAFPLSRFQLGEGQANKLTVERSYEALQGALRMFDMLASGGAREKRVIATGNLLKAAELLKSRGQIVNFSDAQGRVMPGIMMGSTFKFKDVARSVAKPLGSAGEVLAYMRETQGAIYDTKRTIEIRPDGASWVAINLKGAKDTGGQYYLNPGVLAALRMAGRSDFTGSRSKMSVDLRENDAGPVVQAMMAAGAKFERVPVAAPGERAQVSARVAPQQPAMHPDEAKARAAVTAIVRQMTGGGADLAMPASIHIAGERAARIAQTYGDPSLAGGFSAEGLMTPMENRGPDVARDLITVSMAAADHLETAAHESWHWLSQNLRISPREREILRSEEKRLRRLVGQLRPDLDASTLSMEELTATIMGREASRMLHGEPDLQFESALPGPLRRMIYQVARLLRRIRNALRGLGFKTSEDIFKDALGGKMHAREPMPFRDMEAWSRSGEAAMLRRVPKTLETVAKRDIYDILYEGIYDRAGAEKRLMVAREASLGTPTPAVDDIYAAKRLMDGKVQNRKRYFEEGFLKPALKQMATIGLSIERANEIAYALRAPEYNDKIAARNPALPDAGSGMSTADAQAILAAADPAHVDFVRTAGRDISQRDLTMAERGGLISSQTKQRLENDPLGQNYFPLTGFEDPEREDWSNATSRKAEVRGPDVRKALGRWSAADGPFTNALLKHYRTMARVERNAYAKTLARFLAGIPKVERDKVATLNKTAKMEQVEDKQTGLVVLRPKPGWQYDPGVLAYKVGGRDHHIEFKDAQLGEDIKRLDPDQLHVALQWLQTVTNIVKRAWTASPTFIIRHIQRYTSEAMLNARTFKDQNPDATMTRFAADIRHAVRAIMAVRRGTWQTLDPASRAGVFARQFQAMQAEGGEMNFMRDIRTGADNIEKDLKSLIHAMSGTPAGNIHAAGRQLLHFLDSITNVHDNALRLIAFSLAREGGASHREAALAARDATVDYGKRGRWANYFSIFEPFANTAWNTGAGLVKRTRSSAAFRRGLLGLAGAAFALGLWNYLMAGDAPDGEPWIEKVPEWDRRLNLVILNPFMKGKDGGPAVIKIPMMYQFAILTTLGSATATMLFGKEHPRDLSKMLSHSLLEGMTPFATEANPVNLIVPSIFRPFFHIAQNEDSFGRSIHNDNEYAAKKNAHVNSEQGRYGTSGAYKETAKDLNAATGGSAYQKGAIDLYPEDIKHVVDSILGAQIRMFGDAKDYVGKAANGEFPGIPGGKVNSGTDYAAADRASYYRMQKEVYDAEAGYKKAQKDGPAAAKAFREQNAALLHLAPTFHSADSERGRILKSVRDGRATFDSVRDKMDAQTLRARSAYHKAMGE